MFPVTSSRFGPESPLGRDETCVTFLRMLSKEKIEKKTLHNLPFQDQRRVGCSQQRKFVYISSFPCKRISRSYVQKIQGNLDAYENLKIALTASKSDLSQSKKGVAVSESHKFHEKGGKF